MSTPSSTNDRRVVTTFPMTIYRPKCPKCQETFARPPFKWNCQKCDVKCWQPYDGVPACTICGLDIGALNRRHCHRCGHVVCNECGQYNMMLPSQGQNVEKERVCKGCAIPPDSKNPIMSGFLTKISRDPAAGNKVTSRNLRYFELRRNVLMYTEDRETVWKGFFLMEGVQISNDSEEPALGFVISPGDQRANSNASLQGPIYLLADKVQDKVKWVNSILSVANGGIMIGDREYEATDVDGHCGDVELVDGGNVSTYFIRLKGTQIRLYASKDQQTPFDSIILHGGTKVEDGEPVDSMQEKRSLLFSGPRLTNNKSLRLLFADAETKNGWKRNIFCAMRGGNSSAQQLQLQNLPEVTLRTICEDASSSSSSSFNNNNIPYRGNLELRGNFLVWGKQSEIYDIRGATIGVDPNRARICTVTFPPSQNGKKQQQQDVIALKFDDEEEFKYWKTCLQNLSAGKPMPTRRFGSGSPDNGEHDASSPGSASSSPANRFSPSSSVPMMQGFLMKVGAPKGSSGSVAKNKRHFRIFSHFLQYAEDDLKKEPQAKGEFDIFNADVSDSANHELGIFINGPKMKRPLVVIAATEGERQAWASALSTAAKLQLNVTSNKTARAQVSNRARPKGIGLKYGQAFNIAISVQIEASKSLQRSDPTFASMWNGKRLELSSVDATSLTLESLLMMVEGILFPDRSPNQQQQKQQQGILLVPGRFVAFRRLNFDAEDEKCGNVNSAAAHHLHTLRGDDEVAGMLHRLPDYTYLDEIPLRSGDTIVWRDVSAENMQNQNRGDNDDESYLDDAQYYQNRSNSKNNNSIFNNNNSQYRSDRSRLIPEAPALSVDEYAHRQMLSQLSRFNQPSPTRFNPNDQRQQSPYVSPSRYQGVDNNHTSGFVGISPPRNSSPHRQVAFANNNNYSRGPDEVSANLFPANNNNNNNSSSAVKSPPPNLVASTSMQLSSPVRSGSGINVQRQNQMSWITTAYPQRKPYDEYTPSSAELLAFELRRLADKDQVY